MRGNAVKFSSPQPNDFGNILKQKVDAYFADHVLSKKANGEMILKSAFYLGGYFWIYALAVFGHFSPFTHLVFAALLGVFTAGIGFNIGHDALHGAYSNRKWINTL